MSSKQIHRVATTRYGWNRATDEAFRCPGCNRITYLTERRRGWLKDGTAIVCGGKTGCGTSIGIVKIETNEGA